MKLYENLRETELFTTKRLRIRVPRLPGSHPARLLLGGVPHGGPRSTLEGVQAPEVEGPVT